MPDFVSAVLKQLFAGRIEHQYPAASIYQDDPVNGGLDHRPQSGGAFAQLPFHPFAFSEIVDDSDKDRSVVLLGLAHCEVHGESRTVLALPEHLAANADDLPLACALKIIEVMIV